MTMDALIAGLAREAGVAPTITLAEQIAVEVDRLSPRLREVIGSRFPGDGSDPQSLAEIAERLHVSTERARQLEARALDQLKERVGTADARPVQPI